MNVKTKFVVGSLMALSLSTAYADTLQEAIQYTVNENPEIRSAAAERSAVEEEIGQAKARFFPTIDTPLVLAGNAR